MNLVPLKTLTYDSTNLAEDTTPTWSATSGYAVDTIRQLNTKLYQALGVINPLCEYVHDNSDPLKVHYTYTTLTGVEVLDNTAVTCKLNVTVVYNKDEAKYYLFDNSSGCTNLGGGYWAVNFTTQVPPTPVNFTETAVAHRYEVWSPEDTPLKWDDLGYTNKYKCLDQSLSSQTVKDGDITMSFIINKIDEIYLLNLIGTSLSVTVSTTDTVPIVLYDETIDLIYKDGGTFYNYFFNDFAYKTKATFAVPIALFVKVDITIFASAGSAKVGLVGMGQSYYIGATNYGAGIGMIDFSKKSVDSNGETYLVQSNYKATNDLAVDIPTGLTDYVYDLLILYRSTPVIFRNDQYDSLIVFGIYSKFNILINTPTVSKMSISLESLI